jgi:hypothetical protein
VIGIIVRRIVLKYIFIVLSVIMISCCSASDLPVNYLICVYAKDINTNGIPGLKCTLISNGITSSTVDYTSSNYNYSDVTNDGHIVSTIGQASFIVHSYGEAKTTTYFSNFSILIEDPSGLYLTTNVVASYGLVVDEIYFPVSNANDGAENGEYYEFTNEWVFMTKKSNS